MAILSRRAFGALLAGGPLLAAPRLMAATAVDDPGFVRIGGIDQWVSVNGTDVRNPAILYLHGGPGEAQSPFLRQFLPWELDFTVVNWDQRGAGRTFGRNGAATPDLSLDRLVDDTLELAEHIRRRLQQKKLILVGQSWGSFLGVHAVKRQPGLFHAFVGTGQFVSFAAVVAGRVRWAREQATAAGDAETLKALDDAALLPPERRGIAEANAARKWMISEPDRAYQTVIDAFTGAAPYPAQGDVADWFSGSSFSGSHLIRTIIGGDLVALGTDMPVPFFVIQGRDDHIISVDAAKSYAAQVRAPAKAYVEIDGGHYACFTHADQFVAALRTHVRPLAT